jgi:hypothetical protein
MPKFVVERNIPRAGLLSDEALTAIAELSCSAIRVVGTQIQWIESFVTDDKVYCIYIAPDEATIRRHAALGGIPADSILPVRRMLDPTTAEHAILH